MKNKYFKQTQFSLLAIEDKFFYNGDVYQKIAKNTAVNMAFNYRTTFTNTQTVEIPA